MGALLFGMYGDVLIMGAVFKDWIELDHVRVVACPRLAQMWRPNYRNAVVNCEIVMLKQNDGLTQIMLRQLEPSIVFLASGICRKLVTCVISTNTFKPIHIIWSVQRM